MSFLLLLFSSLITVFGDGQFHTTSTGKGDRRFAMGADDLNVPNTGGESSVEDVPDMDNVVTSDVFLSAEDGSHSALVTTTSAHDKTSDLEGESVDDLVLLQVKLDRVVDLDDWIRVTDGAAIVSDDEWDTLISELNTLDFAKLVGGFFGTDSVDGKTPLDVEHDSEVLPGLFDGDDIHEAGGELGVSSDLVVNLDESLGNDQGDFTPCQGVFETVSEEHAQRKTLAQLVRTWVGSRSVSATKLVEHP